MHSSEADKAPELPVPLNFVIDGIPSDLRAIRAIMQTAFMPAVILLPSKVGPATSKTNDSILSQTVQTFQLLLNEREAKVRLLQIRFGSVLFKYAAAIKMRDEFYDGRSHLIASLVRLAQTMQVAHDYDYGFGNDCDCECNNDSELVNALGQIDECMRAIGATQEWGQVKQPFADSVRGVYEALRRGVRLKLDVAVTTEDETESDEPICQRCRLELEECSPSPWPTALSNTVAAYNIAPRDLESSADTNPNVELTRSYNVTCCHDNSTQTAVSQQLDFAGQTGSESKPTAASGCQCDLALFCNDSSTDTNELLPRLVDQFVQTVRISRETREVSIQAPAGVESDGIKSVDCGNQTETRSLSDMSVQTRLEEEEDTRRRIAAGSRSRRDFASEQSTQTDRHVIVDVSDGSAQTDGDYLAPQPSDFAKREELHGNADGAGKDAQTQTSTSTSTAELPHSVGHNDRLLLRGASIDIKPNANYSASSTPEEERITIANKNLKVESEPKTKTRLDREVETEISGMEMSQIMLKNLVLQEQVDRLLQRNALLESRFRSWRELLLNSGLFKDDESTSASLVREEANETEESGKLKIDQELIARLKVQLIEKVGRVDDLSRKYAALKALLDETQTKFDRLQNEMRKERSEDSQQAIVPRNSQTQTQTQTQSLSQPLSPHTDAEESQSQMAYVLGLNRSNRATIHKQEIENHVMSLENRELKKEIALFEAERSAKSNEISILKDSLIEAYQQLDLSRRQYLSMRRKAAGYKRRFHEATARFDAIKKNLQADLSSTQQSDEGLDGCYFSEPECELTRNKKDNKRFLEILQQARKKVEESSTSHMKSRSVLTLSFSNAQITSLSATNWQV